MLKEINQRITFTLEKITISQILMGRIDRSAFFLRGDSLDNFIFLW